jgi:maltooligosyltrehalose trehalohydrolase
MTDSDAPRPSLPQRSSIIGATVAEGGRVRFRVWAPEADRVDVVLYPPKHPAQNSPEQSERRLRLTRAGNGYFETTVPASAGAFYKYSLDGGEAFPDPASRFQPEGPHGPSQVVDPSAFAWSRDEAAWPGVSIEGQVLYELHIGTFTPAGTFMGAIAEFERLRSFGITTLEIMPVAEFPGSVGWGYDGVDLFAPYHHYGTPDDLRTMIDAAHRHGLGIILDVVYNHLGPDGNYLGKYASSYFHQHNTEWGLAINFDGENSAPVRDFFLVNVAMWIGDYHFDGLRLDATQAIIDRGCHGAHILADIARIRREAAAGRKTIVIAENEPQDCCLICPVEESGYGLDGVWNDDFHHSAVVALTGRREAYYSDHLGRPQEFISAAKYGYLFQGQYYTWQRQRRGTSSLGFAPRAFVTFLENHDQVANFGRSLRLRSLSSPARYRAMTALWLLGPGTPLFFQGQEYGATNPFFYFAGHAGDLANAVSRGRAEFLLQFASQDTEEMKECFVNPVEASAFQRSKLDPDEQQRRPEIIRLHRELLRLRREDPVLARAGEGHIDGAVLGEHAFLLRFFAESAGRQVPANDFEGDRLLVVNLGTGLDLTHAPEPLLAPPRGCEWSVEFSSERCSYGGSGASAPERFGPWQLQGECAQLLIARRTDHKAEPEAEKTGNRPADSDPA